MPGIYPALQGMTGGNTTPGLQNQAVYQGVTGTTPGLQNQAGAPGCPYPVAAYRHNIDTTNMTNNVVTAGHYNDIRRQPEASVRDRSSEGAAIDRQIAITERNTGGQNIGQRDSD